MWSAKGLSQRELPRFPGRRSAVLLRQWIRDVTPLRWLAGGSIEEGDSAEKGLLQGLLRPNRRKSGQAEGGKAK